MFWYLIFPFLLCWSDRQQEWSKSRRGRYLGNVQERKVGGKGKKAQSFLFNKKKKRISKTSPAAQPRLFTHAVVFAPQEAPQSPQSSHGTEQMFLCCPALSVLNHTHYWCCRSLCLLQLQAVGPAWKSEQKGLLQGSRPLSKSTRIQWNSEWDLMRRKSRLYKTILKACAICTRFMVRCYYSSVILKHFIERLWLFNTLYADILYGFPHR